MEHREAHINWTSANGKKEKGLRPHRWGGIGKQKAKNSRVDRGELRGTFPHLSQGEKVVKTPRKTRLAKGN